MKLLIDENLPYQIGKELSVEYLHATRISDQATDSELWRYAKEHQLIILSKDTDFFDRLLLEGTPPKVIWVRLGNLTRQQMIETLTSRWPVIQIAIQQHDLVQIHPDGLETMDFQDSEV